MRWLVVIGEWLVLLPLWRRLIQDPSWRIVASVSTGIAWFAIIIAAGAAGGGEGDDDKAAVGERAEAPTTAPSPSTTGEPEAQPTEEPQPSPTSSAAPQPAEEGFGDGTYAVGVDFQPGTYRAPGSSFWERLSGFGGTLDEIIANNVGSGANRHD